MLPGAPLRLLFVGTSPGARGPEQHLVTLTRALHQLGHHVHVITTPGSFIDGSLPGMARSHGHFRNALDPRGWWALLRASMAVRPHFVVAGLGHEYWPAAAVGRLTGAGVLLVRHINARLKPSTRAVLSRLARFVAVSRYVRDQLTGWGVPPARILTVYNPIDVPRLLAQPSERATQRAALGVGPQDVLVGYAGGLEEFKGAWLLAEAVERAMAALPHLKALWIGPAERHAALGRAFRSPHRHTLLPWTAELGPLYAAMDVLAVPTLRPETFGRVAAEAQACGTPVLASATGGLPEAIQDGVTGWLVAPGDVEAWTAAIVRAATAPERPLMGQAGARWVRERFAADVIARDFTAVLTALR